MEGIAAAEFMHCSFGQYIEKQGKDAVVFTYNVNVGGGFTLRERVDLAY